MEDQTRHELMFQARMNIWYHETLERRYELWLNWTSFFSLICSSAAFVGVVDLFFSNFPPSKTMIVAIVALVAALLNGGVRAFGMLNKFRAHADLKRQWIEFLGRLDTADDEALHLCKKEFHVITSREPAAHRALLGKAYTQTCQSLGLVA